MKPIKIEVLFSLVNVIHMFVQGDITSYCGLLSFIYEPPIVSDRLIFWRHMITITPKDDSSSICIGD